MKLAVYQICNSRKRQSRSVFGAVDSFEIGSQANQTNLGGLTISALQLRDQQQASSFIVDVQVLYPGIHSNQLAGNINSLLRDKIRDPAPLDLFPVDAVINYTALASAIVASRTLSARVNQPSSNFETNTSYDRSGDKIVKFSATAGTMKSRVPLASPRMRGGRGIGHIRPPRSYTVSWETGEDPAT
jgi:hypothetical protein